MKTLKINVYGRVQGVAYRYYTKLYADDLNLNGTVRNLLDGSVEVYVTGEEKVLARFLSDLRQGSPYAKVEEIKTEVIDMIPYDGFQILI